MHQKNNLEHSVNPPLQNAYKKRLWIGIFLTLGVCIFIVKDSLLPFVLGFAIAYILNPCVVYATKFKIPRSLAAAGMIGLFLMAIFLIIFLVFPLIKSELQRLLLNLPLYIERFQHRIATLTELLQKNISSSYLPSVQRFTEQYIRESIHWLGIEIAFFLRQNLGLKNIFSLLFITPVAAFYCLKDWPRILQFFDECLPRPYRQFIQVQAKEIHTILANFARGQASICTILTLYYVTTLGMIHLNFFLVIGFLTGILSFIPYLGAFIGLCTAIIVAVGQTAPSSLISFVFIIFIIGQILEGYILTPRLVGHKIGLPPLWIIFSLIVGGNIFGFTGIILAVPITAILGVLTRSGLVFYKNSVLYRE